MTSTDTHSRRRLHEIRAAHGFLRGVFVRSSFAGEEFDKAVDFAKNVAGSAVDAPAQVIRRLLHWYGDGNPGLAWRVLDAGAFTGGVLWLQASLDRLVAGLKGGKPAVLFITGMREAVRPGSKRWSPAAEREKEEFLHLLEQRVERWSRRTNTPVSLFVS